MKLENNENWDFWKEEDSVLLIVPIDTFWIEGKTTTIATDMSQSH